MDQKKNDCPTVGVIGGGQLAQMLAKAGKKHGVNVIVQTGSSKDPAGNYAYDLVLSHTQDIKGTRQLSDHCNSITFENEWLDIEGLSLLEEDGVFFVPNLSAISPLVNKLSQRKLIDRLHIPGPKWISLSTLKLDDFILPDKWTFPLMAKSSIGGYDGKGTKIINDYNDLKKLLLEVNHENWFLEQWVSYIKELSLVISRSTDGVVKSFPLTETIQDRQICDWVLAPADVNHAVKALAYNLGVSLVRELNYVGVLAIEFFWGESGLLVNEIAPRTHNSAHFTIEGCKSSQFEHQILIAAGLPVPSTDLISPGAIMVNLLGYSDNNNPNNSIDNRLNQLSEISGLNIHWYDKQNNAPGRKLGHVTMLLKAKDCIARKQEAINAVQKIRSIWPNEINS
ncbi:5-(carboxyamino)imidazole ribonucleotide synthase [Prochlorococcus marinus]|uniref:5-(carboxyamino)imidazole ribonucleotide synthase n=1 Tax=Prochlorococcus marinus TaxID=1219 RepID=UPI0022B447CD|nr:5-(carboxyamino)imidazole ribonucleotide synthase [Prochlorococcus marinus]